MRVYAEQNGFYANFSRIRVVQEHLKDIETTYFEEFDPKEAKKHDLVLFQDPDLAEKFTDGVKYIWNIDDAMDSKELYDVSTGEEVETVMQRCFKRVDGVIYGSPQLKEHYAKWYSGKSIVIENYIDPCHYTGVVNIPSKTVHIGFFGTYHYAPEVMEMLPVLKELKQKHKVNISIIGVESVRRNIVAAGLYYVPYMSAFGQFPYYLAKERFNIGIVWYKDKQINMAKTGLKFANWAYLGIPVVASRHINERYITDQAELAGNLDELYQKLEKLILDEKYRVELGRKAQHYAVKTFSLHDHLQEHIDFYQEVIS